MIAREYEGKDYEIIKSWYDIREIKAPEPMFLPPRGFIVDEVACGFLIDTDCKLGILDYYISNPKADLMDRKRALMLVTEALMNNAKNIGCLILKADTQNDTIKVLAANYGFQYTGEYSSFCKEIK